MLHKVAAVRKANDENLLLVIKLNKTARVNVLARSADGAQPAPLGRRRRRPEVSGAGGISSAGRIDRDGRVARHADQPALAPRPSS